MTHDPTVDGYAVTKTGIVIGGAWVPSRSARYADPLEVHQVKRPLLRRLMDLLAALLR